MLPPLPLLVGGCVVEKRAAAWFSFDVTMVALSYDDWRKVLFTSSASAIEVRACIRCAKKLLKVMMIDPKTK